MNSSLIKTGKSIQFQIRWRAPQFHEIQTPDPDEDRQETSDPEGCRFIVFRIVLSGELTLRASSLFPRANPAQGAAFVFSRF
jgi:hypothetical protein